jgi:hypothetical protein
VAWVDPDSHGSVVAVRAAADWDQLLDRYGQRRPSPLASVFDVAKANGCRAVVIENRYVDADFRSEYSAFWSLRFQDTSPFSQRLHFFRKQITDAQLANLPADPGYIGYSVLRATSTGRVGRTVLTPPRRLRRAGQTLVDDEVRLFGQALRVSGVPYCEQDGEFLVCAHVAAWMCHYSAHRRGLVGRHVTAQFAENAVPALVPERAVPSKGLTLNQIQAVFGATGQPALFYGLTNMPNVLGVDVPKPKRGPHGWLEPGFWDTRMFSVICRYLNSGFPVLIGTRDHAFVIVGWFAEGSRVRFVASDDQQGPYELIKSPFTDQRAPWRSIMVPLPPKVYLSGEMAENEAHFLLRLYGAQPNAPTPWKTVQRGITSNAISLRTFLREGSAYKEAIATQKRGPDVVRLLRLARLPHWVWVVEAHERVRRDAGQPSVVAEAVFDSTSSDASPRCDAISLPGLTATFPPSGGSMKTATAASPYWTTQL